MKLVREQWNMKNLLIVNRNDAKKKFTKFSNNFYIDFENIFEFIEISLLWNLPIKQLLVRTHRQKT